MKHIIHLPSNITNGDKRKQMCVSVCVSVCRAVFYNSTGMKIKPRRVCFVDEWWWIHTSVLCMCVRQGKSQVLLLQMSLFAISGGCEHLSFSLKKQKDWFTNMSCCSTVYCMLLTALCQCVCVCVCVCVLCVSNLLQWAVTSSRVRSGTPWLWCECNEGFRCRSSRASRPSPSPKNYRIQNHTSFTFEKTIRYETESFT